MNTQQLYISLHVIPYPGVDHLIELLAQTWQTKSLLFKSSFTQPISQPPYDLNQKLLEKIMYKNKLLS